MWAGLMMLLSVPNAKMVSFKLHKNLWAKF